MKKIMSLLVTAALLLCTLPVGSIAMAADNNLIFELDLSEYDTTGKKLKNAVAGSDAAVSVSSTGVPDLGVLDNGISQTKYLTFGDYINNSLVNRDRAVSVSGSGFRDKNEITVETWARVDFDSYTKYGRMFALRGSDKSVFEAMTNGAGLKVRPGGDNTGSICRDITASAYNLKWTHFVFTRKWNPSESTASNGTWSYNMYADGVKVFEANTAETNRISESDCVFIIGSDTVAGGSFSTLIGDISTFKIYDKILSADEAMANFEATQSDYIVLSDTMEVEGTSIGDTAETIDMDAGEITVKFSNFIDLATLGGVAFTKADGTEIEGGTYVIADGSGLVDSVKIKYGTLKEGESYTLSVADSVKSINNIFCTPYTKTYRAAVGEIFYEDFMGSEYVVGQNPPTNMGIEYTSKEQVNNSSGMKVCGDDTFKYISMTGGGELSRNNKVKLVFDEPIDAGCFVVEVKLRAATSEGGLNNAAREIMNTTNQDGREFKVGAMSEGAVRSFGTITGVMEVAGSVTFSSASCDENGFYSLRVLYKKDESGNYKLTFSNMSEPEDGEAIITPTVSASSVKAIQIGHLYPTTAAQAQYDAVEIAKIHIYKIPSPDVLYTNISEIGPEEDEFFVAFSDDMVISGFDENTFKLHDADNKLVDCEFVRYDQEDRKAYIRLKQYLNYASDYTLSIKPVSNKSGMSMADTSIPFKAKAHALDVRSRGFHDKDDKPISAIGSNDVISFRATLKNTGAQDMNAVVALAVYDNEGRLISLITNTPAERTIGTNKTKTVSASTEGITLPDGATAKAIIWSEEVNGAIVLEKPMSIS